MLLTNLTATEYEDDTWLLLKQLEGYETLIYDDGVQNASIGVGFNLTDADVLDAVLEEFGFNLSDPTQYQYRSNLLSIFQNNTSGWQSLADAEMATWATYVGGGARSTFEILSVAEAKNIYDDIHSGSVYENAVDSYISGISGQTLTDWENSYERMTLLSFAYNNIGGVLNNSTSLAAAIEVGDRAEGWYEITFNTNYGASRSAGILKRRIVEGETFGLYDGEVDTGWTAPSEAEALKVFRMLNKHQVSIAGELTAFPNAMTQAAADWNAISIKSTTIDGVDSDDWLSGEFAPAANVLTDKYLAFVTQFEEAILVYESWEIGFENLVDYDADAIFVAAESLGANGYGHGQEVAARTVDRTQAGNSNDLIFSGIDANSSQHSYSLSSGAGNDVIVLGAGTDSVDGGDGFDGVSLQMATTGQTLNFATGQHSGSVVNGDTFSNVEYFIGSNQGDTVTGGEDNLIFFGGDGIDTITGGSGDDILFAGGGASNTVNGGEGYDDIWGGSGEDTLNGGDDYDILYYEGSGAGVSITFQNGVGTGSGGDAEGDTVSNFETIVGSAYNDTVYGWSDANASNDAYWFEGLSGIDTVNWTGDGFIGFDGGGDADTLNVSGASNRAWVFFVGGSGSDELNVAENTVTEFSGGAGADYLYATNSFTQGVDAPYWIALGSGIPEAMDFAGYYMLEDYSDKTEDRFYFDAWELVFDLSSSDFVMGGYGEYLFYTEGPSGSVDFTYRGEVDANGTFIGDASGDIEISFYLTETYDTQSASGLQDLYVSIEYWATNEEIADFDINGFEQGDYGIAFDIPSGMGMSFASMSSSAAAEDLSLQSMPLNGLPTGVDSRTTSYETTSNSLLKDVSWDFDFEGLKGNSHPLVQEAFLRAYEEPEEFRFDDEDAGWLESTDFHQLPDDFSHELHRPDFDHHELMA